MGMGDEIMVAGEIKRLAAKSAERKRYAIWDRAKSLPRWNAIWEHNPLISRPGEWSNDRYEVESGRRPYIVAKTPTRWTWKAYGPPVADIYLNPSERDYGKLARSRVLIHTDLKPLASPNKDWGFDQWQSLVDLFPDVPWMQIGPVTGRKLNKVPFMPTPSFRYAVGMMSHARAAVWQEGGLHHAAAALSLKSVVIFGGFISPECTGYVSHRNLFRASKEHPLGCGMRTKCPHCEQAMRSITPQEVMKELESIL
jgi:hypothetical protein